LNKSLSILLLALIAVGFAACGDRTGSSSIPAQQWNDMVVRVETHPNPPLAGMSEIVVIVTGLHGKPAGDLTVSLRGTETMPWIQAIQDGFIGVYRRAVDLGDGPAVVLQVRLQQGADQKILLFPLKLAAG
jgi:hypothetical protein